MTERLFRKGFTLTELIVIVLIIATLTVILLPALSQAREKSKDEVCISNLKQLLQALHRYCQDYDDALLLSRTSTKKWMDLLDPYTGTNRDLRIRYDPSIPYHCPVALETHSQFKKVNGNTLAVNGYAYLREDYIGEAGEWTDLEGIPPNKLGKLQYPDKCVAFGDAHWDAEANQWTIMIDVNPWAVPDFIHDGGANFVFFDGHAEYRKKADVPFVGRHEFWWPYGIRGKR